MIKNTRDKENRCSVIPLQRMLILEGAGVETQESGMRGPIRLATKSVKEIRRCSTQPTSDAKREPLILVQVRVEHHTNRTRQKIIQRLSCTLSQDSDREVDCCTLLEKKNSSMMSTYENELVTISNIDVKTIAENHVEALNWTEAWVCIEWTCRCKNVSVS